MTPERVDMQNSVLINKHDGKTQPSSKATTNKGKASHTQGKPSLLHSDSHVQLGHGPSKLSKKTYEASESSICVCRKHDVICNS